MNPSRLMRVVCLVVAVFAVAGMLSGRLATAQPMSRAEARRQAAQLSALGQALFADKRLSGSGRLACASCHDPDHAYGPPNALAVQLGGGDMRQPGVRAVPSLKYLQSVPQFTEHYFDSEDEADESIDNGPTGGLTWDGRVDSAHAQARIPLLSAFEMGNREPAEIGERALTAGYGPDIAAIYGPDSLKDGATIVRAVVKALEVYQQDWREFYPYSSKYDAYLAGRAMLTAQEAHGLELFEDPRKGNCASCHISRPAKDGSPPQFSDFGLIALGLPRNPEIPANADPAFYDLGLCGPLRSDFEARAEYCGLFLTPSLRNVATRRAFFHNGVLHSLTDAVAFYATRDTDPAHWYPTLPNGSVAIYNDLPARFRVNVNTDPPFGGRPGDRPALDTQDIEAIVVFLGTLNDGWKP